MVSTLGGQDASYFNMFISFISGVLAALSLPTSFGVLWPSCGWLAWFALIPLYLSIRKKRTKWPFMKGFCFGAGYFMTALYWITIALYRYGNIPLIAAIGALIVLVCVLALFPALITYSSVWIHRRGGPIFWAFPLSWVSFEFLRNYFPFQGFPWANITYSQRDFLTFIQMLDVVGIYGILFLIVLINVSLGELIYFVLREVVDQEEVVGHKRWGSPWIAISLACLLCIIAYGYGVYRLKDVQSHIEKQKLFPIALIQGNVAQDEKWLEDNVDSIISRYIYLSEEAQKQHPALMIWPESSFPTMIPPETAEVELLKNIHVPLLMGMLTYEGVMPDEWPPPALQNYPQDDQSYNKTFSMHNGAALIYPGGFLKEWYFKKHLVPLGEYVPFKKIFFFIDKITEGATDFSPGKEWKPLELAHIPFGVTICYEDLFPEISRTFVKNGAQFLVNLTNDAWYEKSSAIYQHFDFSRFRAIETRRSMVRVTNTGLSGVFSPTGETLKILKPFSEEVVVVNTPVGQLESFYVKYGDLFAKACVGLWLLLLAMTSLRKDVTCKMKPKESLKS